MNLEKLKYIIEIAETGSIALASENLHVSQSGLSQSISSVEKELGVKIFNRSRGQDTELTNIGKKIVEKAIEVLLKYEEIEEIIKAQNIKDEIILPIQAGYESDLIQPVSELKSLYPNITFKIIEKSIIQIIEGIENRKFDLGLVFTFGNILKVKEFLDFRLILKDKAKLYVAKNSELASLGKINITDLINRPFIAFQGEFTNFFKDKYTEKIGPLNILFESNKAETINKAVSLDLGSTITFDFLMKTNPYLLRGDIISIDIIDDNGIIPLEASFGWVFPKNIQHSPTTEKFMKYIETAL